MVYLLALLPRSYTKGGAEADVCVVSIGQQGNLQKYELRLHSPEVLFPRSSLDGHDKQFRVIICEYVYLD